MSSEMDATNAATLWPSLERALSGKTWDGKEVVLYAFAKFVESSEKYWSVERDVAKAIEKVSWTDLPHVVVYLLYAV
jgi:proteasome component ECM29